MERRRGVVDIAESFVLDQERVYVKPAVLPIAVKQHPPTRKKAESVLIEVLNFLIAPPGDCDEPLVILTT